MRIIGIPTVKREKIRVVLSPQVATHKDSVTRCRSEGLHYIALGPWSRRTPYYRVLWGMISPKATQYKITQ